MILNSLLKQSSNTINVPIDSMIIRSYNTNVPYSGLLRRFSAYLYEDIQINVLEIFKFQGGIYSFQLVDWYVASFGVPLFCILECIMISWIYGKIF